ncbi:polysaccharide biosynthesis/export family protein, partial [Candidatus Woesearchaeota archaeon]|nr:polysaccharide biosynthesis/export family protein [Candidatus Woesearchaeota archaeon]
MKFSMVVICTILSLITVSLTGCFSSNPKDISVFLMPDKSDVSVDKYILHPPDEIEVHCAQVPEIDKQRQQIRPDGKISFEAIGEIDAVGKTPSQIANILEGKILELYEIEGEHTIDVRVVAFRSKRYYVLGQVGHPGAQVYTGRDTVIGALALAGSPTVLAWVDRIQVIKPSANKDVKPKIFEFNFDRAAAHGDATKDVLLEPGDIIYVPPTVLAAAAMKIEEFIRPIARAPSGYYISGGGSAEDA